MKQHIALIFVLAIYFPGAASEWEVGSITPLKNLNVESAAENLSADELLDVGLFYESDPVEEINKEDSVIIRVWASVIQGSPGHWPVLIEVLNQKKERIAFHYSRIPLCLRKVWISPEGFTTYLYLETDYRFGDYPITYIFTFNKDWTPQFTCTYVPPAYGTRGKEWKELTDATQNREP